jgi:splicing factor U2AF subunit
MEDSTRRPSEGGQDDVAIKKMSQEDNNNHTDEDRDEKRRKKDKKVSASVGINGNVAFVRSCSCVVCLFNGYFWCGLIRCVVQSSRDDKEKDKDRDRKRKDREHSSDRDRKKKDKDRKGDKESSSSSRHHSRRNTSDSESGDESDREKRKESKRRSDDDKHKDDSSKGKDRDNQDKEKEREKEKEKEKEKDGSRRRESSESPGRKRSSDDRRRRDNSRSPDRSSRRDYRDRRDDRRDDSRDRYRRRRSDSRDSRRRRDGSRDRRDRDRDRERENRDRDRERDKDRVREKSKDKEPEKPKVEEVKKQEPDPTGQLSLKDIIKMYPGISIVEAAQRLNAHNSAVAARSVQTAGSATNPLLMAQLNAASIGVSDMTTKPHRELYVGNLPPGVNGPQLVEFLTGVMKQLGLTTSPSGSVVNAWISTDAHYAFVEFRTIEETLSAITHLNGLQVGAHALKIGRPKGYTGAGAPMDSGMGLGLGMGMPLGTGTLAAGTLPMPAVVGGLAGAAQAAAPAASNVIMVTNLPASIDEPAVKELLGTFGAIKAFNTIRTPGSQAQSAVVEYVESAVTDIAIGSLGKIDIAGFKLTVQRVPASTASLLLQPTAVKASPPPSMSAPAPSFYAAAAAAPSTASSANAQDPLASMSPTTILRLSNMTTPEDLADDEMYGELKEDVIDECNNFGKVLSTIIPRGVANGGDPADEQAVGYIFVEFSSNEGATKARNAVNGRTFNGKIVAAHFYPEGLFHGKVRLAVRVHVYYHNLTCVVIVCSTEIINSSRVL